MNPHRISFARMLPILALLLSYIIVAVPATMAYVNLKHISYHGGDVTITTPRYLSRVHHDQFLRYSLTNSAIATSHAIQSINEPARFIEHAIDRLTKTWPQTWSPRGIYPMTWQVITLPIYCWPFWWFAGVGLDGVSGRRRLRLWELLVGSLLWFVRVLILLLYVGRAVNSPQARHWDITFVLCGLILWTVLFSAFPIAWLKQWLIHRRIRASLYARLSAELQ